MKKKVLYIVFILLLVFLAFIIFKLVNNKTTNISKTIVYIESTNSEAIKNGTGFVYKKENGKDYILTNYHVIEQYQDIYVYNVKKERAKAQVVDYNIYNDIAILTTDSTLNLETLNLGDSSILKENDEVYVVGNPDGVNNFATVTKGKIIGRANHLEQLYGFIPIIVSAKTDFGSSGSPVLDSNGDVVGIIFLKEKNNDESYFIPINDIDV